MSSVVKSTVGWPRTSPSIDFAITTRVRAPAGTFSSPGSLDMECKWHRLFVLMINELNLLAKVWTYRKDNWLDRPRHTRLLSLFYEGFQSFRRDICRYMDGWPKVSTVILRKKCLALAQVSSFLVLGCGISSGAWEPGEGIVGFENKFRDHVGRHSHINLKPVSETFLSSHPLKYFPSHHYGWRHRARLPQCRETLS